MLEYMLIRKVENNIWEETKKWLSNSEDNKLLIVIDEAHMYSGASGGEVVDFLQYSATERCIEMIFDVETAGEYLLVMDASLEYGN
jgi:hypothetical protein